MIEIKTGIDLIEINRIENSIHRNPRFLTRVFSEKERILFASKPSPYATIAANFAAKEAFSKALGCGVRGFYLSDISVLRNALGAPYYELSGTALTLAADLTFELSLTHTRQYAAAMVVAYRK